MCLMDLPIPTSLVDRSLLTRFHMETKPWLFYYRKALSMEIFRQTDLGQEAIRLTAGDGGPSTGCQTHSNT